VSSVQSYFSPVETLQPCVCNRSLLASSGNSFVTTSRAGHSWCLSPALAWKAAELNVGRYLAPVACRRFEQLGRFGSGRSLDVGHQFDSMVTRRVPRREFRYGPDGHGTGCSASTLTADTWDIGDNRLSRHGFGYGMLNGPKRLATTEIRLRLSRGENRGPGWPHHVRAATPVWLDLSLGLYDLNRQDAGDNAAPRD